MQIETKFQINSIVWLLVGQVPNIGKVDGISITVTESHLGTIPKVSYMVRYHDRLSKQRTRDTIDEALLYSNEEELFESIRTDLAHKLEDL